MKKVIIENVKVGDLVMPPARELNLWMRRTAIARGLPESALHLTVTGIKQGKPDKGGRWLIVETEYSTDWRAGLACRPFCFKARPGKLWAVVG